jgi:putative flippase GtrA
MSNESAPELPDPTDEQTQEVLEEAARILDSARGRRASAQHYVLVRHRHNWMLLMRFCVVGGTGFLVNVVAFAALIGMFASGSHIVFDLPGTEYNIRAYHAASCMAFLIANTSNYMLNRSWTFGSRGTTHWLREYVPFLTIGIFAQVVVLAILTVLLHADSPVHLDSEVLAQAIAVVVVTPLSFILNKLWTFRAVRDTHRAHLDPA